MIELKEIPDEPQISTQQTDNFVLEPQFSRRSEKVRKSPYRYDMVNDFGKLHLIGNNDTKKDPIDYTEVMLNID